MAAAKFKVSDIAKRMGKSEKDVLFQLQSLGADITDAGQELAPDVINALLTGKKLTTRTRSVIMREDKPQPEKKKEAVRPPRPIVQPTPRKKVEKPVEEAPAFGVLDVVGGDEHIAADGDFTDGFEGGDDVALQFDAEAVDRLAVLDLFQHLPVFVGGSAFELAEFVVALGAPGGGDLVEHGLVEHESYLSVIACIAQPERRCWLPPACGAGFSRAGCGAMVVSL